MLVSKVNLCPLWFAPACDFAQTYFRRNMMSMISSVHFFPVLMLRFVCSAFAFTKVNTIDFFSSLLPFQFVLWALFSKHLRTVQFFHLYGRIRVCLLLLAWIMLTMVGVVFWMQCQRLFQQVCWYGRLCLVFVSTVFV